MGKQTNFYMSESVQTGFIEYLENNNFIILDYYANIVEQPISNNVYSFYLYKQNYGDIIMSQGLYGNIDSLNSPVIQFSKTIIKNETKKIRRGRIWISDKFINKNGELIKKDVTFLKDYQMLTRWIKKNVPYQEIKNGEYLIKEYVSDELKELQKKGYSLTL